MSLKALAEFLGNGSLGTWLTTFDAKNTFIGLYVALKSLQRMSLPTPLDLVLPFLPYFEPCEKPVPATPGANCLKLRKYWKDAEAASKTAYADWAVMDMLSVVFLLCVALWVLLVYARCFRKAALWTATAMATYVVSAGAHCVVYVASTREWGTWTPESKQTCHLFVFILAGLARAVLGICWIGSGSTAEAVKHAVKAGVAEVRRTQDEESVKTLNTLAELQEGVAYLMKDKQAAQDALVAQDARIMKLERELELQKQLQQQL